LTLALQWSCAGSSTRISGASSVAEGVSRDTVARHLAHEPFEQRPTVLLVRVRRYKCSGCGRVWRQDTNRTAQPKGKLSRGGLRWALHPVVPHHLTVSRVTAGLGVSWSAANSAVLAEGIRVLIDNPGRGNALTMIGVDEDV